MPAQEFAQLPKAPPLADMVRTLATNLSKLPPGYCKISGQQPKVLTDLISEE